MKKWKKSDAGQPPADQSAGELTSASPDSEAGSQETSAPEPASLSFRRGKTSVSLAKLMARTVPAERLTPPNTPQTTSRSGHPLRARKTLPMSHDWFDAGSESNAAAPATGTNDSAGADFAEEVISGDVCSGGVVSGEVFAGEVFAGEVFAERERSTSPAAGRQENRGRAGRALANREPGERERRRHDEALHRAAGHEPAEQENTRQETVKPSRPRKERSPLEIAMGLLARREHSAGELRRKLRQREVAEDDIEQVLADLQQRGWQSDERYAQALVRQRAARGQGPLKVRVGLQQAGIGASLGQEAMQEQGIDWQAQAEAALARWLRSHPRQDDPDRRARATRHLLAKGFSASQISLAWRRLAEA